MIRFDKSGWDSIAKILLLACVALATSSADAARKHLYTFSSGTADDSTGTAHGTLLGNSTIFDGNLILDGSPGTYVDLVPSGANGINLNTYPAVTVAVWARPALGVQAFDSLVGFGKTNTTNRDFGANYFNLQAHRNDGVSRAAISSSNDGTPFSEEDFANGPVYNDELFHHYAAVLTNSSISLYTDGALRQTKPLPVNGAANAISNIATEFARIGRSPYAVDPPFVGLINSVEIYDNALNAGQIAGLTFFGDGFPALLVNRQTGEMTLRNTSGQQTIVGYKISSASGGLNDAAWHSISDNFDADDGRYFDQDGQWEKLAGSSAFDLDESVEAGGNGAPWGVRGIASLPIGTAGAWRKSMYEDLQVEIRLANGSEFPTFVLFEGNGNTPFQRSDLNFDNQIDLADWNIFLAHSSENVSGLTRAESYGLGDLNGDLVLDRLDFRLFKADFNSLNGAGSFAAATNVPEPSISALVFLAATCLARWRVSR